MTGFILLLMFLFAPSAQATQFFSDDFENHLTIGSDINPWETSACNANLGLNGIPDGCVDAQGVGHPGLTTAIAAHSGIHTLQSHYDELHASRGTFINRYHGSSYVVWMRWWYRVAVGWQGDQSTGNKQMYNKQSGGSCGQNCS